MAAAIPVQKFKMSTPAWVALKFSTVPVAGLRASQDWNGDRVGFS
ncbi:hypothetical protein [Kamptonema formosum]|nr:hypothetical protein [Oscillatoria sp. PCC 10802]